MTNVRNDARQFSEFTEFDPSDVEVPVSMEIYPLSKRFRRISRALHARIIHKSLMLAAPKERDSLEQDARRAKPLGCIAYTGVTSTTVSEELRWDEGKEMFESIAMREE